MNFNLSCSDGLTMTTRQFKAVALPDIMVEIELFLKGCGFYVENLTYDIPSVGCRNYNLPEGEPF
jgi:hypothetical protein